MGTPKLRYNKTTDRYVVTINGKDRWLGRDPDLARKKYARLLLEDPDPVRAAEQELYVSEAVERYSAAMEKWFLKRPESWERGRNAMTVLILLYADIELSKFSVRQLKVVRDHLMMNGTAVEMERRRPICRKSVNVYIREVVKFVRWCVENGLCDATVLVSCSAMKPLSAGRTEAFDYDPVESVPLEVVEATKKYASEQIADIIDLQLCTAARPGELLQLTTDDIDRSGPVWFTRLKEHKTAHHGQQRVLFFGPRAQKILLPYILRRMPDEPLFQPRDACKRPGIGRRPNQKPNPRKTDRRVGMEYNTNSYNKAIGRACEKAGVPHWHPHQLRHTAATAIKKEYGVEAAKVILGHTNERTTEIYIDRCVSIDEDTAIAREVIAKMG